MTHLIIKNSGKLVFKEKINISSFDDILSKQGSLKIKKHFICDDVCAICLENINNNNDNYTEIKKFECCKKIVHFKCFLDFINNSDNNRCIYCRTTPSEIDIKYRYYNHIHHDLSCNHLRNNDNNKTDKIPIFYDNSNNIIVRYIIFANKFKLINNNSIFYNHDITHMKYIRIICFYSTENFDGIDNEIDFILSDTISTNSSKSDNYTKFKSCKKFLQKIATALQFNKTNKLLEYFNNYIYNSINLLKDSLKKDFSNNLINFMESNKGYYWFNLNTIEFKRDTYNKYFVKIVGEKFRKVFISDYSNIHKFRF
jgi:hypothetical protein